MKTPRRRISSPFGWFRPLRLPGDAEVLAMDEQRAKLRTKALKLLAQREHSQAELVAKLSRVKKKDQGRVRQQTFSKVEGVPADAFMIDTVAPQVLQRENAHSPVPTAQLAAEVVAALQDDGYQSNERYAQSLARHWSGRVSKATIVSKLKAAGLNRDEIATAVEAELTEGEAADDFSVACRLWTSKFRHLPADEKEKARHVRFLQSRGFSLSVAFRVLKQAGSAVDESNSSM